MEKKLREIEKVLDSNHLSSPFLNKPYSQAVIDLLNCYEILCDLGHCPLEYIDCIDSQFFRIQKGELSDSLNIALNWLSKNSSNKQIPNPSFDSQELCDALCFFTNYAIPYSKVTDVFIGASRNRYNYRINSFNKELFFEATDFQKKAFADEYVDYEERKKLSLNNFNTKIKRHFAENSSILDDFILSINSDSEQLTYNYDKSIIKCFVSLQKYIWDESSTLPGDWKFSEFSLEDYKLFWQILAGICCIHKFALSHWNVDVHKKYGKMLLVFKKCEIISLITSNMLNYQTDNTNFDENVVLRLFNLLTYNSSSKSNIKYQPIVEFDDFVYLCPSLIVSDNPEKNLIALIHNKNVDKIHFKEVNRLESIMSKQIESVLNQRWPNIKVCRDHIIYKKNEVLSDVDFCIYDEISKSVLLCELKWLIASESPSEVYAREDEVDHGCCQLEKIKAYVQKHSTQFMKDAFDVHLKDSITLYSCVVTKADVRCNSQKFPVLSLRKFCNLVEKENSVYELFKTIDSRNFYRSIDLGSRFIDDIFHYANYTFSVTSFLPLE